MIANRNEITERFLGTADGTDQIVPPPIATTPDGECGGLTDGPAEAIFVDVKASGGIVAAAAQRNTRWHGTIVYGCDD